MIACRACGAENVAGSRFCNSCGERLPDAVAAPEVRKTVTVVFCDVSGSTALGERLDPEALRRVMTRYFETMTRAIEAHGGTVEKFIGDAVMAVFGIPVAHEDDALRAVRAAADMRSGLAALNKELERDHGATLLCRIGVNTGEVVAGEASARQSLVVGDAVNVAARLEQAAPPGEIYVSEDTIRLVRDAVVAERDAPLDLKGKSEPVIAYRLVEVHPEAAGHARHFDTPLVGRERQLGQLRQVFDEVAAEHVCSLYTLMAPPGTGKSRLVREFLGSVAGAATVARGRCLAYGDGITWFPLADAVREALGDKEGSADPTAEIRALVPDDEHAGRIASVLAGLLAGSDGVASGEEVAWATRRFFEALARERPVVVVLDDVQWAEPGLLELIDHVADWSRDAPILLLCMARPELLEIRPDWGGGKLRATNASLEPLTADESERLVDSLGGDRIDPSTRERILAAAEGNPLFVEEIVAMFTDDDATAGTVTTIPPTIQALLAARLDHLGEKDRELLGRAAVVGEVFYLDAVRALTPEREGDTTRERVRGLLRREMVRPESSDLPGEEAYRFHHALLRDAAYAMLPKETRAELHATLADWLDERAVPETDEFVGYHLGQAFGLRRELGYRDEATEGFGERAAARLRRAGRRAADRQDGLSARTLFARADEVGAPSSAEAGWDLLRFAWMLLDEDVAHEAEAAVAGARGAADASGDARLTANVEIVEACVRCLLAPEGGIAALEAVLDRLRPGFEQAGDDASLAVLWFASHLVPWIRCRFAESRAMLTTALGYARAVGDEQFALRATTARGAAGFYGSTPFEELLEDAIETERTASGAPVTLALLANARASILGFMGREAESQAEFERAFTLAREMRGEVPNSLQHSRAQLAATRDRPLDALPILEASYEETRAQGDLAHRSTVAGALAELYVTMDRLDDARPLAVECRTLGDTTDVMNELLWRRIEARLSAREGDGTRARELMAEALDVISETDVLMDQAETYIDQAEVEGLLGDPVGARVALTHAEEAYRAKGAVLGVERVARLMAASGERPIEGRGTW